LSEIRATTISDETGNGPIALTKQSAAKAWTNSSSTTIRDSFGISSFTDNGTGDFSHALTNSFSSADYAMAAAGFSGGSRTVVFDSAATASDARIHTYLSSSGALSDTSSTFALFGDLA